MNREDIISLENNFNIGILLVLDYIFNIFNSWITLKNI